MLLRQCLASGKSTFIFLICIVLYLLFCILMGTEIVYERGREIYLHEQQLEANLFTQESYADASIEKIDFLLRAVQQSYPGWEELHLTPEQITQQMEKLLSNLPEATGLRIADMNGDIIYSTGEYRVGNIAARAYFQKTIDPQMTSLVISSPLRRLPEDDAWIISFSRALKDKNDQTIGIVQTSILSTFFDNFYTRSILLNGDLQHDRVIAIVDERAILLGSAPPLPDRAGNPFGPQEFFRRLEAGEDSGTFHALSPLDGLMRIYSFRRLGDYPLVVISGISQNTVLATWKHKTLILVGNFIFISVLFFLLLSMWLKNYHRLLRERLITENYDSLTGLPKINMVSTFLDKCLSESKTKGIGAGKIHVFILDLCSLRKLNETYGYKAGDWILKAFAERFSKLVPASAVVGRYHDDEFVFVIPDLNNLREVSNFANALVSVAAEPVYFNDNDIALPVSIGISVFPDDGNTAEELIRNAEMAVRHIESADHSSYFFFSQEINAALSHKRWMDAALKAALNNKTEFQLYYQPQVRLADRRLIGCEALIRWFNPEKGLIPPDQFIPFAESSRLILSIGQWVLYEACRQRKAWLDSGITQLVMAVNLSAAQFRDPALCRNIVNALESTGLAPCYLELEITETVAMDNTGDVIARLEALHAVGVTISIDDFGTGYSSLSYLKRFPISKIKIDRSFVQDIHLDQESVAIVESIVAIAKNLGLHCIAEGVETAEQAEILCRQGCDQIQGYFTGRPVPAEEMTCLLERQQRGA